MNVLAAQIGPGSLRSLSESRGTRPGNGQGQAQQEGDGSAPEIMNESGPSLSASEGQTRPFAVRSGSDLRQQDFWHARFCPWWFP